VIVLALLFGSLGAALYLAHRYHLGVAQTLAGWLVGGGALAGLYVAWATYRDARRDAAGGRGLSLAEVTDELADAIRTQWVAEAKVRQLNDPYPLPVSWGPADASLTDGWDVLVKLATSGAGRPPRAPGAWAHGPDALAGVGGQLVDVLARVPTGRLVVLGEPGAGKTMLMVWLMLDLLARRRSGDPVPVLVSLASWDATGQGLHEWLTAQLTVDHPALAYPPPPGAGEATCGQTLVAARQILPILDGLDEIPKAVRGSAITRINDALQPGEHLVLTCRTEEYRDAVRPPGGEEVTLRAAAAVQLRPLDAEAIADYLRDAAGGPIAAARWDPVLAVLGTQAPAGQALTTPLMAGLARIVYNRRPGEPAGELHDPAELCSPALGDRAAVERHLFDGFIPAAYRPGPIDRWTAQQAEKLLVFLARHLEHTIDSPDLAWWQLGRAVPSASRNAAALVFSLGAGLMAGLPAGLTHGLLVGLLAGFMAWASVVGTLLGRDTYPEPRFGFGVGRRTVARFLRAPAAGLVTGLGAGLWYGPRAGLVTGLVTAFLVARVAGEFLTELHAMPGDLAAAASPQAVFARNRRVGLQFGIVFGLMAGLLLWLGAGLWAGLVCGFVFGFYTDARLTAWPTYVIARVWLVLRRGMPWSLMGFLADAHQRGVLRQAGAVYQFRHIELQHHLASRP
jgi:hypothetical protein